MRLIDADALEKTLRDWIRGYWTDDNVGSEFANMIDHAETIEQSPIVHAHWIKGAFGDVNVTCSNCDFHLCIPDSVIPKLAYCPHCGAAMDTSDKSKDKR